MQFLGSVCNVLSNFHQTVEVQGVNLYLQVLLQMLPAYTSNHDAFFWLHCIEASPNSYRASFYQLSPVGEIDFMSSGGLDYLVISFVKTLFILNNELGIN